MIFTMYEEYPIYEPAEGGYYYSGNNVVATEKMDYRKAKRKIRKFYKQACAEYGVENVSRSNDFTQIRIKTSPYIGDAFSYAIKTERNYRDEICGYKPYC